MRVNTKNRKLKVSKPRRSYLDSARQIVALLDGAGVDLARHGWHHRHLGAGRCSRRWCSQGCGWASCCALRWRYVRPGGR